MGRLKQALLGISPAATRFDRRGFEGGDAAVRERIETIGAVFLDGYHAALLEEEPSRLAERLDRVALELRGFAYEGAAMGLMLSDFFTPWQRRWQAFLKGAGAAYCYLVHVGAGWALARLPVAAQGRLKRMDPLLRWLVLDGFGFHQGYFYWKRFIAAQANPKLSGYGCCAFDQGLGRSLWFVKGAEPARIAAAITAFPEHRRGHLWSGVGLACAYAGGADHPAVEALRQAAGVYLPQLAQGAAFAAKARQRAGNPAAHTEMACQVLCELSADRAAALTDVALQGLPAEGEVPAYEIWRRRVQARFHTLGLQP